MELQAEYPFERFIPKLVSLHLYLQWIQSDMYREAEEAVGLLKNELKLTMAYLQIHPKVYWIWNHRKWCLEHVPLGPAAPQVSPEEGGHNKSEEDAEGGKSEEMTEGWRIGFWKGELAVIEALLDADPRNCMSLSLLSPTNSTFRHQNDTDSQSTHGIIVDTYSHPSLPHSHQPEPQLRNWHIQERKSKATLVISQLGTVGQKYLVDYGKDWIRSR
jgi:hypothetical protein